MPAAVDSTFLLALGAGDKTALEVNRLLRNSKYFLFCTNTPLIELAAADRWSKAATDIKKSATNALAKRSSSWGIQDHVLKGVNNGIAEHAAKCLVKRFPWLNLQQGLTIAEASIAEVDAVLTWDSDLLKIESGPLFLVLKGCDLNPLAIISPNDVLNILGIKKK